MKIQAERGVATIDELDDFTSLSLEIIGPQDAAIGPWGRWVDSAHVAIGPHILLELAGDVADDPDWRDRFSSMISYARTKGWSDEYGAVRIHVANL
ncbi:hypothetical protein GCM10022234_09430 [Aeromicrobium panaciterrae]|uniref:hypothetical protein n=1 Tax=Aeromicrobium panaciterrae TaxID=363861 RepID=UPI0031E32E0F